jgi:hypothetical protein
MTPCKLCGLPFDAFPKSHIIPDFMYKHLKNDKSQILRLRMPVGTRLKPIFTGFYQKPFLCYGCEKKIGKWETYSEKILYGSTNIKMPKVAPSADSHVQDVLNVDYSNFKLFLLSVLWRASVTCHEFFKEVALGPNHEKILAAMLNAENPGDEESYPVMMIVPKGLANSSVAIFPPYKSKSDTNAVRYVFPISEAIYVFHVSPHGLEELQRQTLLKKSNTMKILYWPISRVDAFLNLYNVKKEIQQRSKRTLFFKRRL